VFKLRDPVTPYDLEQSLLRPQYDPLCGDLISRLVNKRYLKSGPVTSNSSLAYFGVNEGSTADYEEWNVALAKRFSSLFKTYKKFSAKYFSEENGGEEEVKEESGGASQITVEEAGARVAARPRGKKAEGFKMPEEQWE